VTCFNANECLPNRDRDYPGLLGNKNTRKMTHTEKVRGTLKRRFLRLSKVWLSASFSFLSRTTINSKSPPTAKSISTRFQYYFLAVLFLSLSSIMRTMVPMAFTFDHVRHEIILLLVKGFSDDPPHNGITELSLVLVLLFAAHRMRKKIMRQHNGNRFDRWVERRIIKRSLNRLR